MISKNRTTFAVWTTHLLSAGRIAFTGDEAAREIGVNHGAFLDTAERLQRHRRLIKPSHGFYVTMCRRWPR